MYSDLEIKQVAAFSSYIIINGRASPDAAVKLCLGDLLVMGSNPKTVSLHLQG